MTAKPLGEILTAREMEFARWIAEGFSNRGIAQESGCSEGYVNKKVSAIYLKLGYGRGGLGSSYEPRILLSQRYYDEHWRDEEGGA